MSDLDAKIYSVNDAIKIEQKAYNKAIDDFVKFANTMPGVEAEDGEIRPMSLEEIAETLKYSKIMKEWN